MISLIKKKIKKYKLSNQIVNPVAIIKMNKNQNKLLKLQLFMMRIYVLTIKIKKKNLIFRNIKIFNKNRNP